MSLLVVRGSGPLRGRVQLPGDKSISHRALILGALAEGTTEIRGLSLCEDVGRTRRCLGTLGVAIDDVGAERVAVRGAGKHGLGGSPATLDCGDSGTTMRLLAGVLAGQDRRFALDGSAALRRRPMNRVVEPLRLMGAQVAAAPGGHPPVTGQGGPLVGAEIELAQPSAQAGSAVLLAGLNAVGRTVVRYPQPVRDHTERMLAAMGAAISWTGTQTILDGPATTRLDAPAGGVLHVPGDLSSAANLMVAATIVHGSTVQLRRLGVNPGRTGLLDVLASMGAAPIESDWGVTCGEPVAALEMHAPELPLAGVGVGGDMVPLIVDELPLVAVLGTQSHGRTVVRDAGELRLKESDRIAAVVDGLALMGAHIRALDDGFEVEGPTALHGAHVDGHGDHRIVMALAVAGLVANGETSVTDADRIADSYPGFVQALVALGADVTIAT